MITTKNSTFNGLKPRPPYVCKELKSSNGKNHEDPKNDKYASKTYTFDVTKCDEIFDILVNEGIIVVPKGLKLPPLEQRQKRGFCKLCWNKLCLTLPPLSFHDNKVLKSQLDMLIFVSSVHDHTQKFI